MNLFSLTLLLILCASTVHSTKNRIVGGKNADEGEFPYQISLQYKGQHFCGGSLLSESWIVTAAHCNIDELSIEAVAGAHDLSKESDNEQRRTVEEFINHEDYKGGESNNNVSPNDVAVVKVEQPFELNSRVAVVALPEPDTYPSGSGVVSGWGAIKGDRSEFPDILQKATLPIHPQLACFLYWPFSAFANTNICAGPLTGSRAICSGDSGGPLVQGSDDKRTLVGIVSWGAVPCGRALKPGVFVQVSKFIDWIDDHIH